MITVVPLDAAADCNEFGAPLPSVVPLALPPPAMNSMPPLPGSCRTRPPSLPPRAGHVLEAAVGHGRTAHAAADRNDSMPPLLSVVPRAVPATFWKPLLVTAVPLTLPPTATYSIPPLPSVVPLAAPATFSKAAVAHGRTARAAADRNELRAAAAQRRTARGTAGQDFEDHPAGDREAGARHAGADNNRRRGRHTGCAAGGGCGGAGRVVRQRDRPLTGVPGAV